MLPKRLESLRPIPSRPVVAAPLLSSLSFLFFPAAATAALLLPILFLPFLYLPVVPENSSFFVQAARNKFPIFRVSCNRPSPHLLNFMERSIRNRNRRGGQAGDDARDVHLYNT